MPSASQLIVDLAARGRHHFTTEEAAAWLGGSVPIVRAALRRLKAKGAIAAPHRGSTSWFLRSIGDSAAFRPNSSSRN
jgi:DNA-binding GntR family transcriptional regulator